MTEGASVGFVILSHDDSAQLLRLVRGLNHHYRTPPIAIHHDSHQSPIDRSLFPDNVQFAPKVIRTGWAKWSIVRACLASIEQLYADGGPDWFFVLSATDYPVAPAGDVARQLADSEADALLDLHSPFPNWSCPAKLIGTPNPMLVQFDSDGNIEQKKRFYMSRQFWIPIFRTKPRFRIGRWTWRPARPRSHPYGEGLPCLYGDFWFGARRRVAEYLVRDSALKRRLTRHYRMRPLPEESFFQTFIAANSDFTIDRDSRRWAEWLGGGAHPQWMTRDYSDRALASNAFFARKFKLGSDLLDHIDTRLQAPDA